jgi:hypothetical protein
MLPIASDEACECAASYVALGRAYCVAEWRRRRLFRPVYGIPRRLELRCDGGYEGCLAGSIWPVDCHEEAAR